MKKNSVFFLLLLISPNLFAADLQLEGMLNTDNSINFHLVLYNFDKSVLLSSIESDKQYQINYELRLYQSKHGFWSIIGDRIISKLMKSYEVVKDPVAGILVKEDNETNHYFPDIEKMIQFVSEWRGEIILENKPESRSIYLQARATLTKNLLEPPMKIISIFFRNDTRYLDWIRYSLELQ